MAEKARVFVVDNTFLALPNICIQVRFTIEQHILDTNEKKQLS
jgi:hypothetical protein